MKNIWLLMPFLLGALIGHAQTTKLKKVMSLPMSRSVDDEMPGTRGAAVVWHPVQKKYYAAMAGNEMYPLCIFNATGKRISNDTLNCGKDTRGIWYNSFTKNIQGNGYGEAGWFQYQFDSKGMVTNCATIDTGMHQPNEQAVGAFDPLKKQVIFLDLDQVVAYNLKGAVVEPSVRIHWGRTKKDPPLESLIPETPQEYNYTSLVYTGIKGAELGFLNTEKRQIELYDQKEGYLAQTLELPEDAVLELNFNFSFANNIYWLFNIEQRTWFGYR